MKSNTHRLHHAGLLILAFFATALSLSASVTLGPLFRDGVVLQQGRPVTVWGQADVGEKVHVSFGRQSLETETDAQGHWQVQLAPLAANAQPAELVVQGTNTLRVNDVLVGEVWLCSGQSNMAWTFPQLHLPPPSAPEINDPLLRVFKAPNVTSETPLDTAPGSWEPTSEANAAKLSAVAYYFGRQLRDQLNVPVGLINSSWGGSQIESWMSTPTIAALPMGKLIEDRWTKLLADSPAAFEKYQIDLAKWEADKAAAVANNTEFKSRKPRRPVGKGDPVQPASIYNAMLYPLTPATIRGVIWYQGES
ncbi:MAG: sialate O-acetylesterase, partial [Verrucomicrobiota bacterium]